MQAKPLNSPYGKVFYASRAAHDQIVKRAKRTPEIPAHEFIINALGLLIAGHAQGLKAVDADMHRQFCIAIIEHLAIDPAGWAAMTAPEGRVQ